MSSDTGSLVREPMSETSATLLVLGQHGGDVWEWSRIRCSAVVGFWISLAIKRMVSGSDRIPVRWESILAVARDLKMPSPCSWLASDIQGLVQQMGFETEVFTLDQIPASERGKLVL